MASSDTNDVRGWVYVIVNDLIPDRVKVGFTRKDPVERAKELISTGTTGNFVVIYHAWVANARDVEQEVHRRLHSFNAGLEWFAVAADLAVEEIRAVAGLGLYSEDTTARWHPTQAEPASWAKEALEEARQRSEAKRREAEEEERRLVALAEEERVRSEREERQRVEKLAEAKRQEAERQEFLLAERARSRKALLRNVHSGLTIFAALLVVAGLLFAIADPPLPSAVRQLRRTAEEKAVALDERQSALRETLAALQRSQEQHRSQVADQERLSISLLTQQGIADTHKKNLSDVQRQLAQVQAEKLEPRREADLLEELLKKASEYRKGIAVAEAVAAERSKQLKALPKNVATTEATIRELQKAVVSAEQEVEVARLQVLDANRAVHEAESWWARLGASWILD